MKIDEETTDVLIGGYLSTKAAHEDYESVLGCGERLWGAVVVSKDLDGTVSVEQTDHTVQEGAVGLGGVGFVVGLFVLPLVLVTTAIGAAVGAVWGKLLHIVIGRGVEKMAGETIPIGGAGLIVAYPRSAAEKVEPAVTRALQKVVGKAEGHHVEALKGALAEARRRWPRRAPTARALQTAVGEAEGHHVQALKGALDHAQHKMADVRSRQVEGSGQQVGIGPRTRPGCPANVRSGSSPTLRTTQFATALVP